MKTSTPQLLKPAERLSEGSLARCEAPYVDWLTERGYTDGTIRNYTRCLAHFTSWAADRNLAAENTPASLIRRFVKEHLAHCECPFPVHRKRSEVRAALSHLLPALDAAGITYTVDEPSAIDEELNLFDAYLRDQRGLRPTTRMQRRRILGGLLALSPSVTGRPAWKDATRLRRYLAMSFERMTPGSSAVLAGAVRSYLRYRASIGDDVAALLPVIASPAQWRLGSLPATLSKDEVERVLASFDSTLPSWRRGRAVAHCVARLGLRSAEVVGLDLEDLDWDAGTIRLRACKSRRVDVMPLPLSVGQTIVEYLRHERPVCNSRRVFVRHVAPTERPLLPSLVKRVLTDAYARCDLPYTRVHILRHSLAARVLDEGGTLKEVADILRHRALETTQIYAKVDLHRLAAVAMPWPGSGT